MRVITTIQTDGGERAVGTKANATVTEDVLKNGYPHFYTSMMVERLVFRSLSPIIVIGILVMLAVCFVSVYFSSKLVSAIRKTESFVEAIAHGELHTGLDAEVLERRDELGEMGCYLLRMQKSLRELVEQDILTDLYNRRSGEKLLKRICENYRKEGVPFCVVIGDIDHFMNVNDTYGHECGDIALAKISEWIKEHMQDRGIRGQMGRRGNPAGI